MNKIEPLLKELKSLGFSQEQTAEVIGVAEKEIADIAIEEFSLNADEQVVDEYTKKFQEAKGDAQKLSTLLHEVMAIQYGKDNVAQKKEDLLCEYLQNVIDLTKETREVYDKYSQGDPDTVKAVDEAKNSPVVKKFSQELEQEEKDKQPQDNG